MKISTQLSGWRFPALLALLSFLANPLALLGQNKKLPPPPSVNAKGEYDQSVPIGPNHRLVDNVVPMPDGNGGQVDSHIRYTVLASGLNYWDGAQWVESEDKIEADARGAMAAKGQYQVVFGNNLNRSGVIELTLSDGQVLKNHPLGLYYLDAQDGRWAKVSDLQDCSGELLPPNQVIYRNAFAALRADVKYTYQRGQFEADVILRESPPPPQDFGLNNDTTRLVIVSEFIGGPDPQRTPVTLKQESDPIKRATMNTPDLVDEALDFGSLRFSFGQAFDDVAPDKRDASNSPFIAKQWNQIGQRKILWEQIEYNSLQVLTGKLPAPATKGDPSFVDGSAPAFPDAIIETAAATPFKESAAQADPPGVVLDWSGLSGNYSSLTLSNGWTYHITGYVNVQQLVIQSGSVTKFQKHSPAYYLKTDGTATSSISGGGGILTAEDDNTVGEVVSRNTLTGTYADTALFLYYLPSGPYTVNSMDIRYALSAVVASTTSGTGTRTFNLGSYAIRSCTTGFQNDAYDTMSVTSPCFQNVPTQYGSYVSHTGDTTCANTAPVIRAYDGSATIPNISFNEDTPTGQTFLVTDLETSQASLSVVASSSNPGLLPNGNLSVSSSGGVFTVMMYPTANASGTAIITITATDGGGLYTSKSFTATVNAVNDPPSLSGHADWGTVVNKNSTIMALAVDDVESGPGGVMLSWSASPSGYIQSVNFQTLATPVNGYNRTMVVVPVANTVTPLNSSVQINIIASDPSSATTTKSFNFKITPDYSDPDGFRYAMAAQGNLSSESGDSCDSCDTCGGDGDGSDGGGTFPPDPTGGDSPGSDPDRDKDQPPDGGSSSCSLIALPPDEVTLRVNDTCGVNDANAPADIHTGLSIYLGHIGEHCDFTISATLSANFRLKANEVGGAGDMARLGYALSVAPKYDGIDTPCRMQVWTANGIVRVTPGTYGIDLNYDSVMGHNDGTYGMTEAWAKASNFKLLGWTDSDPECTGLCSMGIWAGTVGSVDMNFKLGRSLFGRSKMRFGIRQDLPSAVLSTPKALYLRGMGNGDPGVDVVCANGTDLRQIKTPTGLADIVTVDAFKYQVKFYDLGSLGNGGNKTNGLYVLNGNAPQYSYEVNNPNQSTNNTTCLRVLEFRGSNTVTNQYDYIAAVGATPARWELTSANKLGLQKRSYDTNSTVCTETHYKHDNVNTNLVIRQKHEKWTTFAWGNEMTEKCLDATTNPRFANYSYGTNVAGNDYGKFNKSVYSDGRWRTVEYDGSKRIQRICKSVLNQGVTTDTNLCRAVVYDYTPITAAGDTGIYRPHLPRLEIAYLMGKEIGRKYYVYRVGEKQTITCTTPGAAWNDSANLVNSTKRVTSGFFQDMLLSVKNVDGTYTFYDYATNSTYRTNIVWQGQPNSSTNGIQEGTKTVTIQGTAGQTLSTAVYAVTNGVMSGIVLSQTTYSNFDVQNRAQRVDYLDGTLETMSYSCCGLDTKTDRDGVTTQYFYDDLKRLTNQVRLGISTLYTYDAAGRVIQTARKGTDGTTMILSGTGYDLAGRVTATTNAAGVVTTYSETTNVLGQIVKTTTYASGTADAMTRIETYALDGRLATITGTGVANPVRYDAGVELDGGVWRSYRKEIKLDASGNDTSEWTKTYADFMGRNYKTVTSAASGVPTSQVYFNNLGQTIQQVDADGVSTVMGYNLQGEACYSVQDINRNGVIDFGGTDRISWTTNDVLYSSTYGCNVRRTRTFIYPNANDSATTLEVSRSETSTDGLRTWTTAFGLVTQSQTVYNGTSRTNTVTNPDNSTTVTVYQNGRLSTVTRKDSTGAQLSQTTYAYDAHGRTASVTDARNGTTVSTYDGADRVVAATSPPPGTGQSAQTIGSTFDNLGRVVKLTQPDGASVTNEYYATGQLRRTYGARTYPVGYGYDAQGRVTSMTNWTSFAGNAGVRVTRWIYDAYQGFLNAKRDDNNQGCDYTYTAAGRLLTRTWARGTPRIVTTNVYDNLGQLSSVSYLNDPNSMPSVTLSYDRRGQKTQCVRNGITTTYYYSSAGLPTGESYAGGTLGGLATTNVYDGTLRRTQFSTKNGSTVLSTENFGYDNASRLNSVDDGTGYAASYTYLANSPLVSQIAFKQSGATRMTTTKQYDYLNRLQAINSAPSAASALSYGYAYNDANQRISMTMADGSYWIYQYDSLGQVISGKRFWGDGTPVPGQQYEYGFDDIGNRTSTKAGGDASGNNLRSATYTANNLNQYSSRTVPAGFDVIGLANTTQSVTVNGSAADYRRGEYFQELVNVNNSSAAVWQSVSVTTSGGGSASGTNFVAKTPENYTYDLDGNTTQDGQWVNTFDGENRLIRQISATAVGPQQRLDFEYDCQGRRIRKKVWNNTSGTGSPTIDLIFLYDGWNLMAIVNSSLTLQKSFVWGLDLSGSLQGAGGVGGLIAMKPAGGAAHFAGYDGNGNVTVLVDGSTGTVSALYEFGPFDEPIRVTGSMALANPFRFSTKYQDDETDFLYYGYRFFNPRIGRWSNQDPGAEKGGYNLYAFLNNCPILSIDLLGLRLVQQGDSLKVQKDEVTIGNAKIEEYNLDSWVSTFGAHIKVTVDIKSDKSFVYRWRQHFTFTDQKGRFQPAPLTREPANNLVDPNFGDDDKEWFYDNQERKNHLSPDGVSETFADTTKLNRDRLDGNPGGVLKFFVKFKLELVEVCDLSQKNGGTTVLTIDWGHSTDIVRRDVLLTR